MKKIITTVLLLSSLVTYSQDLITFSFEYGTKESKGFEIRKELNGVYVGLFAENIELDETMFLWGLNAGFSNEFGYSESFKLFYGTNVGLSKRTGLSSDKTQNFMIGGHVELDYNITKSIYIGAKARFDTFKENNSNRSYIFRPVLKVGYKF